MSDKHPDRIWLIEQGYETVWCDCAAPADDIDAADSVGYVRADVVDDLLAALKDCINAMPIATESDSEHKARWKAIAIISKLEDGPCRRLMEAREELKKAEGGE